MHAHRTGRVVALCILLLAAAAAQAEPKLAAIFGEGMVLQRGQPLKLWGRAEPGERVTVSLAGHRATGRAGADGRFALTLPSLSAGGPHELRLAGNGTPLVLRDLWIGDVWLASGQSNMEWVVKDSADGAREVATANAPRIRHVKVAHRASLLPLDDIAPTPWWPATPAHVGDFSAVGYFFAREVQRATGVPIGIVDASWGGTHVETWTSARSALKSPELAPLVRTLPRDVATYRDFFAARQWAIADRWQGPRPAPPATPQAWADPALDDGAWRTLRVPQAWEEQGLPDFDGIVWYRRSVELDAAQAAGAAELQLGAIDDCDETWVNGTKLGGHCDWDRPRQYALPAGLLKPGRNVIAVRVVDQGGGGGFWGDASRVKLATAARDIALASDWRARVEAPFERLAPAANDAPTLLFNGMVQPLVGLGLRGVIWYQGESNVPRAAGYARAFGALIRGWREAFKQPALPFYFVQLASFRPLAENSLAGSTWAELRDAQREVLALPHTGMAVTIDIGDGDDIHPRNKQDVGQRLARVALAGSYGQAVNAQGPRLRAVERHGPQLALRFDAPAGLQVRGGGALRGFAVAERGGPFHEADARLEGGRVWLRSAAVARPAEVRYAWLDNALEANLQGSDGLPAPPFRTDRRQRLTEGVRFAP